MTEEGEAIAGGHNLGDVRAAMAFPKFLLHAVIHDEVSSDLMRKEFDDAVRNAFVAVEDSVREAAGLSSSDYGVDLMRVAFHPEKWAAHDKKAAKSERESIAHLFAGAIGTFKNPVSHRKDVVSTLAAARDQVLLASHLLRIVDQRRSSVTDETRALQRSLPDEP